MTRRRARHPVGHVRLPGPARRAVHDLEVVFAHGTDDEYAAALTRLEAVAATLGDGERRVLSDELAQAHARVTAAAQVTALKAALAGPWEVVRRLPGNVELVRLTGADGQFLATVPAYDEGDSARVRDRVTQARGALREGRCPRCGAGLSGHSADQAALEHAVGCRLSEAALNQLRS